MAEETPNQFGRHSMRLKGVDYSQAGGYFITVVTQLRGSFFGEISKGKMIFNDAGKMVNIEWRALQARFPNIGMDIFQVMPNHIHGIIIIHNPGPVVDGQVLCLPIHPGRPPIHL